METYFEIGPTIAPRLTEQRSNPAEVRVVLVDDHAVFRNGLRELLEERGIDVVGEASDGATAVELVRDVAPDVVVMDIAMPGMSGVEATMESRSVAPCAKVIMLTVSADERDVDEAIAAGACGYLLKDAAVEEIVAGICAAAVGEALLSPRIAAGILERARGNAAASLPEPARAKLTEREREVLNLMAEGKANAEIAQELFIRHTVKNHVSNILGKLESQTRIEAAVKAARGGLL